MFLPVIEYLMIYKFCSSFVSIPLFVGYVLEYITFTTVLGDF